MKDYYCFRSYTSIIFPNQLHLNFLSPRFCLIQQPKNRCIYNDNDSCHCHPFSSCSWSKCSLFCDSQTDYWFSVTSSIYRIRSFFGRNKKSFLPLFIRPWSLPVIILQEGGETRQTFPLLHKSSSMLNQFSFFHFHWDFSSWNNYGLKKKKKLSEFGLTQNSSLLYLL